MPAFAARVVFPSLVVLLVAGCASRPLPKYEKPIARAPIQNVRTTAYTHTEADHLKHGRSTALGTTLKYGAIHSAAADWSRWPAGTKFRIAETGEYYQVDDYGWALAGTNTIDLYKPTRGAMNAWGVRRVNIEVLEWGDAWRSYAILRPRSKFAHVKRMVKEIEDRYDRSGSDASSPVVTTTVTDSAPVAVSPQVLPAVAVSMPPQRSSGGFQPTNGNNRVLQPFAAANRLR